MTDYGAFFSRIDLDRPGLEPMKEGVQAGDFDAAAAALLSYYRHRTGVNYHDGWQRRERNATFDTTEADRICENRLVGQQVPLDIDWQADPHGDPEWKYCLHRHQYLTELGRAYWYTGDEKYTRAWKRILGDWIAKNPMPDLDWMLRVPSETSRKHFMKMGNWRPLTLGIRLYTSFIPCFFHFLCSPEFTPDFVVTVLASMEEHARHTRLYYTRHKSYFNVSPNWGVMEANGLAHMGILFPEFKDSADWTVEAMSRLEEQIRMQVLPDGMQVERASGYHLVCTFCFLQILDLAERNGVRVSDTYRKVAESMIDFVIAIMKPHGVYPMLKDADESDVFGARASEGLWEDINNLNMLEDGNDLRWTLKTGARLFNRPDMLWVATHGAAGEMPRLASTVLPDAGFAVMRTGWAHDDLYLVYTCGELGVHDQSCVHGNADALSIDVSGYGTTLLIDPGRYIYEGPWRVWFKSTKAHNTITVDGQDSSELADEWMFRTRARSRLNCWATAGKFDYVDGQHDGYTRLADPVAHRRRVLFLKPRFWLVLDELDAAAGHTYDQYFHFAPDAHVERAGDFTFAARYPSGAGITVQPLITEGLEADLIPGWVSYDYAVKLPAQTAQYTKHATGPTAFATLLTPCRAGASANTGQAETPAPGVFRIADWLIVFSDAPLTRFGDFEFDGPVFCARYDPSGTAVECFGARTSLVRYRGRTLLDSTVRHKLDLDPVTI